MENDSGVFKQADPMELPPGFRFHPTDEELITHYLSKKVIDNDFEAIAIGDVDMNKVEPWELPWKAKLGEKELYFFCVRDKKYPTGLRTNRATSSGYWKATGKDKEIFRGKTLVGMKKTLVFYKGRAPKGEKTNWVCHEYRLEGKLSLENIPKPLKNDWVISRVFQKTTGGKKVHISGLMKMNSLGNDLITQPSSSTSMLPPLMHPSPSHVHCFSSNDFAPKFQDVDLINNNTNIPMFGLSSSNPLDSSLPGIPWTQQYANNNNNNPWNPIQGLYHHQFQGYVSSSLRDNHSAFKSLFGDYNQAGLRKEGNDNLISVSLDNTALSNENSSAVSNLEIGKKSLEEQEEAAMPDFDSLWNY